MQDILVSIITPSYNQGEYIEETILSVLNQTYPHIEYIILDARSTDNTPLVLDRYEHNPRVSRIIRKKDNGQSDAIEKGFRMAKGEIVGWINSDDILAVDVVEKSVRHFKENSRVGLTYGDIVFIDSQGNRIKTKKPHPLLTREYLLNTDYDVYQPGSFYRKSVVESTGYLNRGLNFCMDLDLWLGILKTHEARYINNTAALFRWHESTKTVNGGVPFLSEIYQTLCRHQARLLPATKRRILWYSLKVIVKKAVSRRGR
jgi:glycosyltransferase involved in cell wall biosynthesis